MVSQTFTDYGEMVGKRPRQAYFKELQDAVLVLQTQYSSLTEGPVQEKYKLATDPIYRYTYGTSFFKVEETVNSGYPTSDGILETMYIDEYRNLQHFFTQSDDELTGETYSRQWKEEFRQWSPWEKVLTTRDLVEHLEDRTAHITEKDRYRIQGYVHEQVAASKTWIVEHHLDKFPSVTIVDSGQNVVVGDVTYVSTNSVHLKFSTAFSGRAFLS